MGKTRLFIFLFLLAGAIGVSIFEAQPLVPRILKIIGALALLLLAASNYRDGSKNA